MSKEKIDDNTYAVSDLIFRIDQDATVGDDRVLAILERRDEESDVVTIPSVGNMFYLVTNGKTAEDLFSGNEPINLQKEIYKDGNLYGVMNVSIKLFD